MSSETSTNGAGTPGLTPFQFFLLAGLGCATAVSVMVRGQGVTTIILLTVIIATTALVGFAALRTLNPLVTDEDDRTVIVGGRTRAALEREKMLALRAIKELEFDRAMGKVSETDFQEMSTRLRTRASRIMRQLDAGADYREQIERDLEKRISSAKPSADRGNAKAGERGSAKAVVCACGTSNDVDAKFCKACGARL